MAIGSKDYLEKPEFIARYQVTNIPNPSSSPKDTQIGGDHYKKYAIQPLDYIVANDLSFLAGNAVKYITRYKDKNGAEDIRKAIHYLELLLEYEFKEVEEQLQLPLFEKQSSKFASIDSEAYNGLFAEVTMTGCPACNEAEDIDEDEAEDIDEDEDEDIDVCKMPYSGGTCKKCNVYKDSPSCGESRSVICPVKKQWV